MFLSFILLIIKNMFKSTHNKGFQITFSNDLTISVQWGTGNYCERKNLKENFLSDIEKHVTESKDAEVAIWDKSGKWLNFGSDEVRGYCTADEVGRWITAVSESESLEDLQLIVNLKI